MTATVLPFARPQASTPAGNLPHPAGDPLTQLAHVFPNPTRMTRVLALAYLVDAAPSGSLDADAYAADLLASAGGEIGAQLALRAARAHPQDSDPTPPYGIARPGA